MPIAQFDEVLVDLGIVTDRNSLRVFALVASNRGRHRVEVAAIRE